MPSLVHIPGRPALLKIKGIAVDLGENGVGVRAGTEKSGGGETMVGMYV